MPKIPANNHPLISLLTSIGMLDWTSLQNFQAYNELSAALYLDGKSNKAPECDAGLEAPISWASELISDQLQVISSLTAGWATSVMAPMENAINALSEEDADIDICFDGTPQELVMNIYYIKDFIEGLDPSRVSDVKDILNDWSVSCQSIKNLPAFIKALDNHAAPKEDITEQDSPSVVSEIAYDVLFEIITGDHVLHNEVRVMSASSEVEAMEFALEAELGDCYGISEQLELFLSGGARGVENHDGTLVYKPVKVIPLQEVTTTITVEGEPVNKTVLLPRDKLNSYNSTRYYKQVAKTIAR